MTLSQGLWNTYTHDLARVRADPAGIARWDDVDADALARAFDEMYAAEGSDWFWWYGRDQDSANDGAFDEIFRGTLANVYTLVGETPPAFLSVSVLGAAATSGGASGGSGGGVMARAESVEDAELLAGPVMTPAGVLFSHASVSASTVHLAGDFNGWDPVGLAMSDEDGDGVWTVTLEVAPGRYEYKFVVDGGAYWEPDTGNPERVNDTHGGENSVLIVE